MRCVEPLLGGPAVEHVVVTAGQEGVDGVLYVIFHVAELRQVGQVEHRQFGCRDEAWTHVRRHARNVDPPDVTGQEVNRGLPVGQREIAATSADSDDGDGRPFG